MDKNQKLHGHKALSLSKYQKTFMDKYQKLSRDMYCNYLSDKNEYLHGFRRVHGHLSISKTCRTFKYFMDFSKTSREKISVDVKCNLHAQK